MFINVHSRDTFENLILVYYKCRDRDLAKSKEAAIELLLSQEH